MESELAALRSRYAHEITSFARDQLHLPTDRIEAAFAEVARERYLTDPPWTVFAPGGTAEAASHDPAVLYRDVLVVLDRARGINNGQPSLHATWLSAVAPQPGEKVVQVGVGAGYYTAILAHLVGPRGGVLGLEIETDLARMAARNCSDLAQVRIEARSGFGELPAADLIYVSAGLVVPPLAWITALRPRGRLIFPWPPTAASGPTWPTQKPRVAPEKRPSVMSATLSPIPWP